MSSVTIPAQEFFMQRPCSEISALVHCFFLRTHGKKPAAVERVAIKGSSPAQRDLAQAAKVSRKA